MNNKRSRARVNYEYVWIAGMIAAVFLMASFFAVHSIPVVNANGGGGGQPDVFIDENDNGVWDPGEDTFYGTHAIQMAIDNATSGDTIIVNRNESIEYSGNIYVDKSLKLIGNESRKPIINASLNADEPVGIHVNCSDVLIKNFIIHDGSIGVHVHNSCADITNVTISDCILYDFEWKVAPNEPWYFSGGSGVGFEGGSGHTVTSSKIINNKIHDCDRGITLTSSANYNTISFNEIWNCTGRGDKEWEKGVGIFLNSTHDNDITRNKIHDNRVGIIFFKNNTIHCNDIFDNEDYGIEVCSLPRQSPVPVNATCNWWGTNSGPYDDHNTSTAPPSYNNTNGTGDNVTAYVLYKPWAQVRTNISFNGFHMVLSDDSICVNEDTEINLTGTTTCPCCWMVNATYYRVWYSGSWDPTPGSGVDDTGNFKLYTGNFTLSGDGLHYLEFYSVDNGSHKEDVQNVTIYLDNKPPEQTVEFGEPKNESFTLVGIGPYTPVWINSTDDLSGTRVLWYRISVQRNDGSWEEGDVVEVLDNSANDTDDTIGRISVKIDLWQTCKHQLHYACEDYAGNGNHINDNDDYVDFWVDAEEPSILCTIVPSDIHENYGNNYTWINCSGKLYINATDKGCTAVTDGGSSGIGRIEWIAHIDRDLDNQFEGSISGVIYDNDENDTNPAIGKINASISFSENCRHDVEIWAYDKFENYNYTKLYIKVDCEPPVINKKVGEPNCTKQPDVWCVTTDTVITFNVTDIGCYWQNTSFHPGVGLASVTYYIWNSTSGWDSGTTVSIENNWANFTVKFNEECKHYIKVVAKDRLGNTRIDNETFYVDDTPPQIIKTVGEPNVTGNGNPDYWVTTDTVITINAEDLGCCGLELENVSYRICYDGEWSSWTDITTELPYTLKFSEECNHTLQIVAKDCLGNTAWDNETFYVDDTPPIIDATIGHPNCSGEMPDEWCITSDTKIWVNATDTGTEPCIVGSVDLYVDVYNAITGQLINSYSKHVDSGTASINFTIPEECKHWINITAVDDLGNTAYHNLTVYVDDSSPRIIKTVGEPNVTGNGNPDYWVTTDTVITINAEDLGCCGLELENVSYRICYDGEWSSWTDITTELPYTLKFSEECNHTLQIVAKDCLGNTAWDNETFYVDDTPPIMKKEIGEPHYPVPSDDCILAISFLSEDNFKGVHPPTSGWSTGDACKSLGTNHLYLLSGNAELFAFRNGDPGILTHRGTRGLGVSGGEEDEVDSIDREESIVIEFTEPVYLCGFEIRSLFTGEGPNGEPEKGDVALYLGDTEVGNYTLVGTGSGVVYQAVPDTKIDKIRFFVNKTADYNSYSEYAVARIYLKDTIHFVSEDTPIYLNITDIGKDPCIVGSLHVRVGVWYNGEWSYTWYNQSDSPMNLTIYLENDCVHYLNVTMYDDLGNMVYDNETFYVDNTPPDISKEFSGPYYEKGDDIFITSDTKIWVNATDTGTEPCIVGSVDLYVDVYNAITGQLVNSYSKHVDSGTASINFTIPEECKHWINITAVDDLGNTAYHNETVYVDNTPPDISKEFSGPYYEKGDDIFITSGTRIWVNATDSGIDPCIVGSVDLYVDVYNAITGEKIDSYYKHVGSGTASINFTIPEECKHWINITAVDDLGNTAYHNETVYVDNTPPEFNKEIGKPHYVKNGKDFITSETPIYFNITDGGTEPCIVGSLHVRVGIWYNGEWNYTWYNQSDSPMNLTIYLENDCIHYLNVTMYDDLGNMVYDNETFYVDNTPPDISKEIGEPNYILSREESSTTIIDEGFESGIPEGWDVRSWASRTIWYDPSKGSHVVELSGGGGSGGFYLITSNFNLEGYTSANLTFWGRLWVGTGDWGAVYISTNGGNSWQQIVKYESSFGWQPIDIDLTPYIGNSNVKLKWYLYECNPGDIQAFFRIDDILVRGYTTSTQDVYLTSQTPIWVNATDSGLCVVGSVDLNVSIYSFQTGEWRYHETHVDSGTASIGPLYLSEECKHWINITAVDDLGNTAYHNETVYVDNTPPEFNKEIGKPHYVKNGKDFITSETPIYFNITDGGTEPCIVGSLHVRVGIWYNGEWNYTWYNQSDSPMNLTIYLENDCIHYLNVTMYDDLGNMVYDNETFYVDNTPPDVSIEFGTPLCDQGNKTFITSLTPIWVNATDSGMDPCIVGSVDLYVDVYNATTGDKIASYHEHVGSGTASINFTIPEDCEHWINITAVDDLGNTAYHNETVYVDNIPPISTIHYKSVAPGWKQMNEEGFGDMSNDYAWGMAVYEIDGKEYLYVGTINTDYTGDPQVDGCEIWRTDGTIGDDGKYVWEQVVGPSGTQMPAGFGMNISGVRVMTVYDGLLWVGCMGAPMEGGLTVVGENCTVWVTNGTEWKMANVPGFGENHQSIRGMAVFNDTLYVGTERNINGEGACIYRYTGPTDFDSIDPNAWEPVLELSANQSTTISVLEVFDGYLYAGTFQVDFSSTLGGAGAVNLSDGCEIWRSSSGDPGTWEKVVGDGAPVPAGFGNENNAGVLSMEVFKGKLYVGTYNFKDRAELWRTSDGLNWEPVILHGLGDNNFYVWSMLAMDGELFIGTMNPFTGCEIWRSSSGDPGTWEKANVDGMDGETMFTPPVSIFVSGLIADQYGIRNMVEYNGSLVVGTASWADFLDRVIRNLDPSWPGLSQNVGCEIWKLDGENLHISREYINCSTLIYINATDMGVGPCVSDKVRIYYRIWYNGEWTPWMHGDINENVTIDLSEYGLAADCKHIIEYYAVDCLGNKEFTHNRTIYVDCTHPEFLILKPQDGWYSDGSVIPSIVLAEDPWVNGCSSGIEEGSQGFAFLIDVFPGFNVVPLNSSNFLYDYESHEYIGNLIIPDPSGLPDGAVLFVAGGSDNVGNGGNSIITLIETYFLQWVAEYGDEEATEAFADWLNDIVTNFNVVVIGIDNTPPMVNITEPEDGADVGIGPIMVKVQAFDNLSGINLGDTAHVKLAGIHIGELVYNETSGLWEGLLAIPSSVPSGEQNLTVEISDLAGNTGSDTIRVIVEERPGPLTTGTTVEPDPAAVGNLIYVNATVVSYISEIADAELFIDEIGSYGTGISMNPADGAWDEMVENVTITIDTTGLSEGVHTVYVHGKDADGRWGAFDEEEFTLYVEDTTPPEFDLFAEKTGVISGSVWYNATNFDPSECVDRVEFYIKPVGGQPIQLATVTEGYEGNYVYVLDTTEYPDGTYYVYAVAYDCAGNSYGGIGVAGTFKRPTIDNTPPSVTITHPSMGSTVSGIVDITFDISDVNSIEEVYVKIDDTEFAVSGDHYEWDTTTVSDGVHMITVRAVDEAGNEGSTWILVSVDNSDESDPNIHIVYPTNGTAIEVNETNRGYLKVKIDAYDDKTSKENLIVRLWIPGGRRDAPTLWYDVVYNESDGYFYANVDIYKYQNGTQITLCASAEDEAGNYQPAPCLNVRILGPVIWDQWMQNGWNRLILPYMSLCDNSVEKVLTSLNGYYDAVFYHDEVSDKWYSYIPGDTHQTLYTMEPGREYWIHMNGTETRFYIDDAAPCIKITYPEDNSLINAFAQDISGTAFDVMGIDYIKVMIEDLDAPCCTIYWNGSAWQSSPCWLLCDGTDYWQYLDTQLINMSGKSGHHIQITAMAVDNLGCSATDTIVFVYDDQPPVSHIDFISPYVNTAPDITGWTEDDYALDYVEVRLNFTNSTGTYYWNFSSGAWQSEEYWEVIDQSGLTDTWDLSASDPEDSDYESGVKYYVTAKATDLAGNKESTAIAFFTYDAIQPFDITIEYPVDGETYNCGEPSEINGTAADGETFVDRVYIWIEDSDTSLYWNGSAWTDQPVDLECSYADGIWSYIDVPEWEDNHSYIVHAFAQDAAGNVNDTTAQFNYSCPPSLNFSFKKYVKSDDDQEWHDDTGIEVDNTILFKLKFINTGDIDIEGTITIVDQLPANLTFNNTLSIISAPAISLESETYNQSAGELKWIFNGTLKPGENITIVFDAIYDGTEESIVNMAYAYTSMSDVTISDNATVIMAIPV